MRAERLTVRTEIEAFLRRDAFLHLYELGDLDDFFWPHTTWFGLRAHGADRSRAELAAVALLYGATDLPVLLALTAPPLAALADLLAALLPRLPPRFYAHLSGDLARVAQQDRYFYAEDAEVPSAYKKLVEEYYKALAKGKR